MANPKLTKVPIRKYSVSFLSFARERSLNRNTDLAAINQPIACHWFKTIKPNTNNRSITPIYFPACFKESFASSSSNFQEASESIIMIEDTLVTPIKATTNKTVVSVKTYSKGIENEKQKCDTTTSTATCNP